jgi:hypothetical protein
MTQQLRDVGVVSGSLCHRGRDCGEQNDQDKNDGRDVGRPHPLRGRWGLGKRIESEIQVP